MIEAETKKMSGDDGQVVSLGRGKKIDDKYLKIDITSYYEKKI